MRFRSEAIHALIGGFGWAIAPDGRPNVAICVNFHDCDLTTLRSVVNIRTMNDVLVTGMDLKLERVARQVKATDLASRMGVSRSYLSALESRYSVVPEKARAYRSALATFPALATSPAPPSAA